MKKYVILTITLLILLVASLCIGAVGIPLSEVISTFTTSTKAPHSIIVISRIPRSLGGVIAGMSLALSGLLMQSLTQNDLSDATILGVNNGASLAVLVAMTYLGMTSRLGYLIIAFIGGLFSFFIVYLMAQARSPVTNVKLILSGAALSMILSACISALLLPNIQTMERFRFFQLGSLGRFTMTDLKWLSLILFLILIVVMILLKPLSLFALGSELAVSLGVNVSRIRFITAFCSILLATSITALCGPIGFIGLMVPHFARLMGAAKLKEQMGLSLFLGAILLLASDIIARLLGNSEVGVMTALIGAPLLIVMLQRRAYA